MRKLALALLLAVSVASCTKKEPGIYASGTIEAREVLISARVGGEVKALHVERSQKLKAGDIIAELDTKPYEIKLKEAESALEMARQNYLKLKKGLRPKEVRQVKSSLSAAQSQYELARQTLERQKELLARGAVSQHEVDIAQAQFELAQAQLTSAKAQYDLAREGARSEDIESARKAVERAESAVEAAKLELEYATIKSPGELVVSEIYVEPGELATPGSAIVLLQAMNDFYVDLFVPIGAIASIKAGNKVEIEAEGLKGKKFIGIVETVYPKTEFTPENISTRDGRAHLVFKVRVKVEDPEHLLKPGLPVDAWIKAGMAENTL